MGSAAFWLHWGSAHKDVFIGYQNRTSLTEAGGGEPVEDVLFTWVIAGIQCLCGQWRRPYSRQETAKTQEENVEPSGSEQACWLGVQSLNSKEYRKDTPG